jgi:hypothetical protein
MQRVVIFARRMFHPTLRLRESTSVFAAIRLPGEADSPSDMHGLRRETPDAQEIAKGHN